MFKVGLLLLALVACAQCVPVASPSKLKGDESCDICLQVMDEGLNILLNEILNGGVVGGCDALCHLIPNSILDVACNLLCDFVGIKEFVKIINQTDPDPIWYCQELHACVKVNGGSVTITSVTVTPASGPIGTTFQIQTLYTVNNATGPGIIAVAILPPGGEAEGAEQIDYGQAPGDYNIGWDVKSDSNFTSGAYGVEIQICEGDCLNKHPYSGIYAQGVANFTITA